uniref:Uncharacterized protein n=1 Tax=Arundo donax TaxID=35708 RepID=A0A0A9GZ05_ARUDO
MPRINEHRYFMLCFHMYLSHYNGAAFLAA